MKEIRVMLICAPETLVKKTKKSLDLLLSSFSSSSQFALLIHDTWQKIIKRLRLKMKNSSLLCLFFSTIPFTLLSSHVTCFLLLPLTHHLVSVALPHSHRHRRGSSLRRELLPMYLCS